MYTMLPPAIKTNVRLLSAANLHAATKLITEAANSILLQEAQEHHLGKLHSVDMKA